MKINVNKSGGEEETWLDLQSLLWIQWIPEAQANLDLPSLPALLGVQ